MSDTLKRKRQSRGFHFYPVKRKKKDRHVQWMSYDRVIRDWGFTPSLFHIFAIEGRGWWACRSDCNFFDNIEFEGDYYRPVFNIEFYDGSHGDMVYGYVGVIEYSNLAIHVGRFVFVKNPMIIGKEMTYILNIRRKINLARYKKFEIWKTA